MQGIIALAYFAIVTHAKENRGKKPKKENCKKGSGKATPAGPEKENTNAGTGQCGKKAKRAGHTFKISMKSMIMQQEVVFLELQNNLKCYGSTTVGERGQIVLPAELRKLFKMEPGDKLIVLADEHAGIQSTVLMKSESVAKMFEHLAAIEKLLVEGGKNLESLQKEGLKKIQAFKENGIEGLIRPGTKKKK